MSEERKPLVTHIYTADPSAHVFGGKFYVYPSHDLPHDGEDDDDGGEYQMEDYHILSADRPEDDWVDNGEALNERDVPWVGHQMWAPDALERDGKYYLYFPAKDKDGIFRLGVAVSDSPVGPFTPEPEPIPLSYSIDPAVFEDDDKRVYVINGGLWGGQMEKWETGTFDWNTPDPDPEGPALGPLIAELNEDLKTFKEAPKHIEILDEEGAPLKAGDHDRRYFEGPWLHKYKGVYYLSYSTGDTHTLVYATAKDPQGPYTYQGRLMDPVIGWTTHHSIVEKDGEWFLFYHDSEISGGINHRRCVKWTRLYYNGDGSIQTIHPYDHMENPPKF